VPPPTPSELRERVRALPGAERLLPALEGLPPAYLVGGVPRDLIRGAPALDLDVAIEGDGVAAAQELAGRLGGRMVRHERFGTATVEADRLAVDVASTRTESYDRPGALPRVRWASLRADLARRDFAVNAMAVSLGGDELGRLHDPCGGLADLRLGVIRVLHERSFIDDPTRLLRAVRYSARLEFALELETERLALDAIEGDALLTVSGARLREELLLLLAEANVARGVRRLHALGLDRALHPELVADAELVAGAELGALETGADRVLSGLAALISPDSLSLAVWLDRLQMPRPPRDVVIRAARTAPGIATALRLRDERKPSHLARLLAGEPPEALALALGLGAPPAPILDWARRLRHVRLEITGDDLRAAGVPPSPALGRALEAALAQKLDGEVAGREEELRAALEAAGATP
jgi:tRNA nucleotidyltransferase (CCA-adding enzyme)